jgi:hypothetical protein
MDINNPRFGQKTTSKTSEVKKGSAYGTHFSPMRSSAGQGTDRHARTVRKTLRHGSIIRKRGDWRQEMLMNDAGDQEAQKPAQEQASGSPQAAPADMQAFIGRQLRAVYDDIAKQPVPDRFLELMKQLDSKPVER